MTSRVRKITIALIVATQIALVAIWALNGYEETWFYATLMIISLSTLWVNVSKKNKIK